MNESDTDEKVKLVPMAEIVIGLQEKQFHSAEMKYETIHFGISHTQALEFAKFFLEVSGRLAEFVEANESAEETETKKEETK